MLSRYKAGRPSRMTCSLERSSSAAERLFSSLSSPSSRDKSTSNICGSKTSRKEPIVDTGLPLKIMTIHQVSEEIHHGLSLQYIQEPISLPLTAAGTELLLRKIKLCCSLCDFRNVLADVEAKEIKRMTLEEIDNLMSSRYFVSTISEKVQRSLMDMISTNIFRDVPKLDETLLFSQDDPHLVEVAWPHLSLCYSILLKLQTAKPDFSREFVQRIINNIGAPGDDEQRAVFEYVDKYIVFHPDELDWILKRLCFMVISYREGVSGPFVVRPTLELLAKRYRDIPAKSPVDSFGLIPLFTIGAPHFCWFWPSLKKLVLLLKKEQVDLANALLYVTIHTWPRRCATKERMYLKLLLLLVERSQADMQLNVFRILMDCCSSPDACVVEKSFKVWTSSIFVSRMLPVLPKVMSHLLPAVQACHRKHWSPTTRAAACNTIEVLQNIKCRLHVKTPIPKHRSEPTIHSATLDSSHRTWAIIAREAVNNDDSIPLSACLTNIQLTFTQLEKTCHLTSH